MRSTLFLLFVTLFELNATVTMSQEIKISLDFKSGTFLEVLNAIESQSDYIFVYNINEVNLNHKVSISVQNKQLTEVLENLCAKENLAYTITDHHIALVRKTNVQQQTGRQIRGTVLDGTGEPIIGANVIVVGTTIGMITDIDGKFTLNAPENSTLRISYIGYLPQEVRVTADRVQYDITMREDAETLDEIVVIGYGSIKKSDITGSVVSVNSQEMMKRNPINIGEGIQGAAAGVSVMRNSGDPEGGVTIRIRGVATVNNSADPLFVVDGIQVGNNANFLNPNDVESIEILKDASATAIYGSKGANGVIMITTKKGSKGHTNLNFSANYGVQTLAKKLDMANAEEFVHAARRASASDGTQLTNGAWVNYDKELNSIDWQKEMSHVALQQNYNLNISGGNESTQGVMSIGYLNNDGIIIESNFRRVTARANLDHKIQDFIRTGVNISYMHTERYGGGNLLSYAGIIPTMDDVDDNGKLINVPIRYADGTWGHFKREGNGDTNKGQDNPVAAAETADARSYNNRVLTNAYLELTLLKGLTFRTIGSIDYAGGSYHQYNAAHERTNISIGQADSFSTNQWQNFTLSLESFLTYDFAIQKHQFNLMAGYSVSRFKPQDINASSNTFLAETIRRVELTSNPGTINAGGGLGRESRGESYFGRINYSFADRYLLTATVRRDGSSNFGAGNRYGTFPSASLAWRMSEEDFIKNTGIFSNLKLRVGWGQTGNAGNSTNLSIDQLSSNRIAYYHWMNNETKVAPGLAQVAEIDTNLKWETNEQKNFGLDLGFFNNNLNISLDYYIRDAKDLLLYRPLRPSTGYNSFYTNAGHIRNSGFEFMIGYQKQVGDWYYNVKVNGATLKNEAIDVGEGIFANEGASDGNYWNNYSITKDGYPVASFYGWRVEGIFQSKAEIDALNAKVPENTNGGYYQSQSTQPGDYKYKDLNNDGYINDEDREVLGDGYPTLNYGLNITVGYKNWDFSLYGYGVAGQDILSYAYRNLTNMYISDGGYRNILADVAKNAWTPENHSTKYPRLTKSDKNHNVQVSDAFIKSGDFFKIQNLQVGYTFPKMKIGNLKVNNLRVYAAVTNLLTITSYPAGDPEIGTDKVLQTGFDGGRYPFPRTYSFGLTVGF